MDAAPGPRILSQLRTGGFRVSLAEVPAGLSRTRHAHEETCFGLNLRGEFEVSSGRRSLRGGTGSVFVRPGRHAIATRFGPVGASSVMISVHPGATDFLPAAVREALRRPRVQFAPPLLEHGRRLRRELLDPDALSPLAIEGLVLEFLAGCLRLPEQPGRESRWLEEVLEILDHSYRDRPSLSSLAEQVGVHPVHLARSFRRRFGETVGERVRRQCLQWAEERLRTSEDSIAAIAQAAGYADQSHFARRFRREFGSSPGEYRRRRVR